MQGNARPIIVLIDFQEDFESLFRLSFFLFVCSVFSREAVSSRSLNLLNFVRFHFSSRSASIYAVFKALCLLLLNPFLPRPPPFLIGARPWPNHLSTLSFIVFMSSKVLGSGPLRCFSGPAYFGLVILTNILLIILYVYAKT